MNDPNLAYYGHPLLPAGFNSAPNDGDEIDGPGYNEPVWPEMFDSFISCDVVILTEEKLEVFDGCPDWVALSVPDLVTIDTEGNYYAPAAVQEVYTVKFEEGVYVVPAHNNTISFPAVDRTYFAQGERRDAA